MVVVPSCLIFCVQHTFNNNIHLDLIVCEWVGTVTVTAVAVAVAVAVIDNYGCADVLVLAVDNYTFVVVPNFVDNKVYIVCFGLVWSPYTCMI